MARAYSRHISSIWEGVDRKTLKREAAFKNKQASKQTRDVNGKTSVTFKGLYTPDVKLHNGTKVWNVQMWNVWIRTLHSGRHTILWQKHGRTSEPKSSDKTERKRFTSSKKSWNITVSRHILGWRRDSLKLFYRCSASSEKIKEQEVQQTGKPLQYVVFRIVIYNIHPMCVRHCCRCGDAMSVVWKSRKLDLELKNNNFMTVWLEIRMPLCETGFGKGFKWATRFASYCWRRQLVTAFRFLLVKGT